MRFFFRYFSLNVSRLIPDGSEIDQFVERGVPTGRRCPTVGASGSLPRSTWLDVSQCSPHDRLLLDVSDSGRARIRVPGTLELTASLCGSLNQFINSWLCFTGTCEERLKKQCWPPVIIRNKNVQGRMTTLYFKNWGDKNNTFWLRDDKLMQEAVTK